MSEQPDNQAKSIQTGGGPAIEGGVDTGGGDFVGRDKTTNVLGDEVHGDKVGGNKVTIGTVINNLFKGDSEDVRKLRNRRAMLKLVHDIWVKGVLEHSLYNQLLIDLDMEQRPEAVERPWGMVLETPGQANRLLPSGTKMLDVFNELNQSLLILGEPGSGKSTMLLELTRALLAQATQNPTLPMPVLFNLSSWAEKRQPLRQWLVDELREKYQIPKALAQTWVEHDELLLLLDGLDEVKQAYHEECIKSLNEFQQSCKAQVSLALCSRTAEYEALTSKLKLNGSIVLRPLTIKQIDTFLLSAGDKLSAVAHLLRHDAELQILAQSPLTFSIICLTYQDKVATDIESMGAVKARLQQLFDAYIVRMFQRAGKLTVDLYPRAQTLYWLAWLAARMVQYAQTEFLIERLQPDWIQSIQQKLFSVHLFMAMWGLIYGFIYGLIGGMIFGLRVGLVFGLFLGLISVEIDWLSGRLREIRSGEQSNRLGKRLKSSIYSGFFWSLIGGLIFGLLGDLFVGLESALMVGVMGLLLGIFHRVKPLSLFRVSPKQMKSNIVAGVILGEIIVLSYAIIKTLFAMVIGVLIYGLWNDLFYFLITLLHDALNEGVIIGLVSGLAFVLVDGSLYEVDELPDSLNIIATQKPNQAIKQIIQISLTVGLIGGLPSGLLSALIYGPEYWAIGVIPYLILALISGGDVVAKHITLRFVLYLKCYAPLNYARFLDYCADRIFLRKVGGGYIFVHRLLMDHFASLTEEDIKRLSNSR